MDTVGDIAATVGTTAEVSGDRCCKGKRLLVFQIATLLIAAIDLASDWVNYVDFSKSNFPEEIYVKQMALIVQISSGLFGLDIILFAVKLRWPESYAALCLGKVITFALWMVEDIWTLALVVAIHRAGYCPLVLQYRTIVGRIAVLAAGASVLWRMITVCVVNRGLLGLMDIDDDSVSKDEPHGKLLKYLNINNHLKKWKGMAILVMLVSLFLAGWCFKLAFEPLPTFSNTVMISQQMDARFYVDGECNQTNSGKDTAGVTWKNVTCFGLTNQVSLGSVSELRKSGELLRYAPCHVVSPFYQRFLQTAHAQILNESTSCTIIFRMKYNQENSELLYYTGYQLLLPDHSCVAAPFEDKPVMVPVAEVWRERSILGAILRGVCDTEYCSPSWLSGTNSTLESRGQGPSFLRHQTGCDADDPPAWSPLWNVPAQLKVNVHPLTFQIDKGKYPCHVTSRFERSLGFNISCSAGNFTAHDNGNVTITLDDVEYSYCDRIEDEVVDSN